MRLALAALLACAGCEGVIGSVEPVETGRLADASTPTAADDAGVTHDDAGQWADAGHEPFDAGSAAPDAGHDAGAPFDAGTPIDFPLQPGPLRGAVPSVTSGPTVLQPLQSAFDDTCAVVWNPLASELLFTVCQVNHLWRYRPQVSANAGFDVVRMGGEGVFGMQGVAVLPDGAVAVAETVQHRLTLSRQGYDAPQPWVTGTFNMPQHLVVRRDGNVYFTDPRTESGGGTAPFTAVYRVAPNGQLTTHHQNLDARGLALSYDGRTLYLSAENRYGETLLYKVELANDGAVGPATLFAGAPGAGGGAFGLCVDQADNVYHAARSGIRVHGPSGAIIANIAVPGANDCAFGDADAKSVYVTTSSSLAVYNLYRVRVDVPGLY